MKRHFAVLVTTLVGAQFWAPLNSLAQVEKSGRAKVTSRTGANAKPEIQKTATLPNTVKRNWEASIERCEFPGGWHKGGHPEELRFLRKLANANKAEQLIHFSEILLKREPRSLDALYFKAQGLSKLGKKQDAKLVCDKILAIDPLNGNTLILRQHCNSVLRNMQEALTDCNSIIKIAPESDKGYWLRSYVYLYLSEPDKAMPDCNKAVELRGAWFHYYNRAVVHIQHGDWKLAIADYTEARKRNHKHHMILFMRGIAYRNIGEYKKAIIDFTTAMDLNPNFWKLYQLRGSTFLLMGEREKARADFERATLNEPNYARNFFRMESGIASDGLSKNANAQFDAVDGAVENGSELFRKGNYEQALKVFNQILARNPRQLDALAMRAQTYRKLKEFDKAMTDLFKTQGWESQSGDILSQMKTMVRFDQGKYAQAVADANAALFFEPSWYEAYYLKGASLDALKRNKEACVAYRSFIDNAESNKGQARAALYFTDKAQLDKAVKHADERLKILSRH